MATHPYANAPAYRFWRKAVAEPPANEIDPVVVGKFEIRATDKVATAGSCFAQHMARYLSASGFSYFVTETAHPILPPNLVQDYNYGTFSARYGNIYTSRQLVQLLHRAYGLFTPAEDVWPAADGSFIDPFRPQIQPAGFATEAEFRADRQSHFAAIRTMVEHLDVFVFTLGLTETWIHDRDGAVFPVCPGVSGGEFDPGRHKFVNLRTSEVVTDMTEALRFIRGRNPGAKFVLTVSPVPLIATAADRHVLVSTTYSKACLRVAAEEIVETFEGAAYFPSYEIITGNHARGRYFADDLRSVTELGVQHVMRMFMRHYTRQGESAGATVNSQDTAQQDAAAEQLAWTKEVVAAVCDEEALDRA